MRAGQPSRRFSWAVRQRLAQTGSVLGGYQGDLSEWDDWSKVRRGFFVMLIAMAIAGLPFGVYMAATTHAWLGWVFSGWCAVWLAWQYFEWRQLLKQRAAGG
jgi:hypothetical protein